MLLLGYACTKIRVSLGRDACALVAVELPSPGQAFPFSKADRWLGKAPPAMSVVLGAPPKVAIRAVSGGLPRKEFGRPVKGVARCPSAPVCDLS